MRVITSLGLLALSVNAQFGGGGQGGQGGGGGGGFGGGGQGGQGGGMMGGGGGPGQRQNGGFQDIRDPCRFITDEDKCNNMAECSYGSMRGGRGDDDDRDGRGPGGRRLQQQGGGMGGGRGGQGQGQGQGGRGGGGMGGGQQMGCRSICMEITEEEDCDGNCVWASGGGRGGQGGGRGGGPGQGGQGGGGGRGGGGGPGRRRMQRGGQQGGGQGGGRGGQGGFGGGGFGGGGGGGQNWRQMDGRCLPVQEAVSTGLEVTMTIYTDQECTTMLDVTQNQNQGPMGQCFGKEEDDCNDMGDDCRWVAEGNWRESDPHCAPNRGMGGGGGGRGGGGQGGQGGGGGRGPGRRRMQRGGQQGGGQGMGQGGMGQGGMGGGRGGQQGGGFGGGRGWDQNRGGRGQDFADRGAGGNTNQRGRLNENPTKRVIPVIDEDGEPKCSFDARADQDRHVFRKTECIEPNMLQDFLFSDPTCEEEVEEEVDMIVRGECMPLPLPNNSQRGGRGRGADGRRQGGGQGQGGGPGRRLLQWFMSDDDETNDDTLCDGEYSEWNWEFETLVDWWSELTCDNTYNDEMDDDVDETPNPCNELGPIMCLFNLDECDLQQGVCVWRNAPDNRRNLYVIYEWQYLMVDGELTDEEFCYEDGSSSTDVVPFTSQQDYLDAIDAADSEAACMNLGGKKWTGKKCKAGKKIKCKNIGAEEDDDEKMERDCLMWSEYPDRKGKKNRCNWDAKRGKCSGKVTIKL